MHNAHYYHHDTKLSTFPRMIRKRLRRKNLLFGLLFIPILLTTLPSCHPKPPEIKIISTNLSHRIVLLDEVETRLNLMIGFKISGVNNLQPEEMNAMGRLSFQNADVASFRIPKLDYYGGNLNFYLPFDISPGDYSLDIAVHNVASGNIIAAHNFTIENIETISARETGAKKNWMQPEPIPLQNPPDEILEAKPTQADRERGYIIWHRNPFRYVYPNSAPKQTDTISALSVQLAQNEYEPATFSLYALKNLGKITVTISELTSKNNTALATPEIHTVKTVPRITSRQSPEKTYELRPRLLEKGNQAILEAGRSQRFWLTLHASASTSPGMYEADITITTDMGQTTIPIYAEVLPFMLKERPDKEYGFMMTYEFQEMTAQDVSEQERVQIYANGLKYYQSFKEHGLTTVFPHSSFTFRRMHDGSPDLRDLEASLKAFVEVGFTGPFIYYCGHLLQNSKPGWAGSTLSFDPERHPPLMKEIISYARQNFPEMHSVAFYWMPGDEVQDDSDGPSRMKIANNLLQPIWEMQEKTAITIWDNISWPVDIQFGSPNPEAGAYWHYPNDLTTVPDKVDDAESIRRTFGLDHIKSDFIGLAPWTFQTSENAAGHPFTDLDNPGRPEVMIAYPGTDGPITTPEYEAVREGIDDGRYAYLLRVLIEKAMNSTDTEQNKIGLKAATTLKEMLQKSEHSTLKEMDKNRQTMIKWIIKLSS